MNLFIPKMYKKDIFSIDYKKIIKDGYKIIIFDLDNTIGKVKQEKCGLEVEKFLNSLNKEIRVIIASNSHKKRVTSFCKNLECDYYYFSLKPSLRIIRKIKNKYHVEYNKMVIVGDQLLTDILLGNRKKILTILVDQIDQFDLKKTKLNRKIEKIIKKKYNLKKGEYY